MLTRDQGIEWGSLGHGRSPSTSVCDTSYGDAILDSELATRKQSCGKNADTYAPAAWDLR